MNLRLAHLTLRSVWHMVFLAIMLTLAPTGRAVWQCGGEICGPTHNTCCCDSPDSENDARCDGQHKAGHTHTALHAHEVGDDCHCTMAWHSSNHLYHQAQLATPTTPVLFVAILPHVASLSEPCSLSVEYPVESRGPPPLNTSLAVPSLRGPPVA